MTMHGLEVREVRMLPRPKWMRVTLANRRRRLWSKAGCRWQTVLSRPRLAASLLTHVTHWLGQTDAFRLIACRPAAAPPTARAA
jgi:hypothetical protein